MNRRIVRAYRYLLLVTSLVCLSGCAAFRAKITPVDVEEEKHLKSSYDYSDMRDITEAVVKDILTSKFLAKHEKPPVVMIAGVQNRTKEYVDTKALTDRIRTLLFQSGKVQFVNEARRDELLKEQSYQGAQATPETRIAVGKQIGAKYMLSGSFIEMEKTSPRQVRVSKQEINYYKLTIEVADLETGLMIWTIEKEFARAARLPLIGW